MAYRGYDWDRDAAAPPDTWGSTLKDTGLTLAGSVAGGLGEVGQAVGAKEFAAATRDVQRSAEAQMSPTGKEVSKAAFIPTEEGETSVFRHPVRSALQGGARLVGALPAFVAGTTAGTAVGGPVGGLVGGTLAGAGQGFGAAEYEARRRVEDMSPEDRARFPVYQEVIASGGSPEEASEKLVAAMHPAIADILNVIGGGAGGGAVGHGLTKGFNKAVTERIALGIRPPVGRAIGISAAEQAGAMGAQSGLGETARQTGDINIGAQEGYEPLKIAKHTGEGAITGGIFGVATSAPRGIAGARTARKQYDAMYGHGEELNELYDLYALNNPSAVVVPAGNAPNPAQAAALNVASATGGPSVKAGTAQAQQAGAQTAQQQVQQAQGQPGTTPGATPGATPTPVVAPPPVTTAVTPAPGAAARTTPVETWADFSKRMVADTQAGMDAAGFQAAYGKWKTDHNAGKPPAKADGGTHGELQIALANIRNDARKAAAEAAKAKPPEVVPETVPVVTPEVVPEALPEVKVVDTAPVVEAARTPEEPAPVVEPVKAPEVVPEVPRWTGTDTPEVAAAREHFGAHDKEVDARFGGDMVGAELAKRRPEFVAEKAKRRAALEAAEQEQIKQSSRPVREDFDVQWKFDDALKAWEKVHGKPAETVAPKPEAKPEPKKPTVTKVEEGVSGVKEPDTGKRTKEADTAVRGGEAVESALQASERLMEEAKAEHAQKVKDGAEERAADRAAGRPVKFKKVDDVETIHARLLDEHRVATLKRAEEANTKRAAKAREVRKEGTEATEVLVRDAARGHVENLSEDHDTHAAEEVMALRQSDDAKGSRAGARNRVIVRAHALVKAIEDKVGEVGGKAVWSKEGKVNQSVMNALRDTKMMLERWAKRDTGTVKAREKRAARINQDFIDFAETMAFLRKGGAEHLDALGARREERSALEKQARREASGKPIENVARGMDDERPDLSGEKKEAPLRGADADTEKLSRASGLGEGERVGREKEAGESLSAHGFTEIDPDDTGQAIRRPTTEVDPNTSPHAKYIPDHLIGQKVRVPVLNRLPGHVALANVIRHFQQKLREPEEQPGDHQYHKHLIEWAQTMRSAVPHIRTEVVSDAHWNEIVARLFNEDGDTVGGVYHETPSQKAGQATQGKILIPERTWNDPEFLIEVLTHEYGHAATTKKLDNDPVFLGHMQALMEKAADETSMPRHNAFVDVYEFAADAIKGGKLFDEMAGMQAPDAVVAYIQGLPKATTPMNMAKAFVGLIMRALNISRPKMTVIEAVVRMNQHAAEHAREITASRSSRFAQATADMNAGSTAGSYPYRIPVAQQVRQGITNQAARMSASGATFTQRWAAKMLHFKTSMQIGQGMDYLFGNLSEKHSDLAKRALELMPDNLRPLMEGKSLSRVYADLHQRQNARAESIMHDSKGAKLTNEAYRLQRKYGLEGTSPDGKGGSMWDFFTKLVHDETVQGAFWGGESNAHLDPKNLDHAQALAGLTEGKKRYAMLPTDLVNLRGDAHLYFKKQHKAMSDWLTDNVVDELTDAIRNAEAQKAKQAPIFDKAGIEDFKQWLRDGRPDTHANKDLYKDILNTGPEGKRLKEIRALAEIEGPYMPLMRRGDYHVTGYHELADAPGQLRRMDKAGEDYDPSNPDHVDRAHEFNTYEFADETTARPFIENSPFKAQSTGEKLVNKATNKVETVPMPKKLSAAPGAPPTFETNYGGNHQIHATRADGIKARDAFIAANYDRRIHTTMQNKDVQFHDTMTNAEMGRREMEAVKGFKVTEYGKRPYEPTGQVTDLMSREMIGVKNAMERSTGFAKLDKADQQVMRDVLAQHAIRVLGSTRVQSHRLPRKNVLGASNELGSNFADFAHSNSGYIARLEFGPHIHRVADIMQQEVKTKGTDTNAFLRSEVMNHLDARRDQVAPPNNDGLLGRSINRLLQLSFLRRLASPAFHVINSMEPYMIGLPYMAGEYGFARSMAALTKAYFDIGGRDIVWHGMKETVKALRENETMDFSDRIRNRFAGDERRMLDDIRDRGMTGREAGMELQKLDPSRTNIVGRAVDRADHVSRQMGQAIEGTNRSVMAVAAYRLAREKLGSDPNAHAKAIEKVAETLDHTMGTYDRWNAPPMFNHPLGRVALQFRKFGQRQYYLLAKMGHGMMIGDHKLENAKAMGWLMGTHFIMAGALGLPTEPVTMAVNMMNAMGLTDETSETLQNSFRETVAAAFGKEAGQFVSTGVPSLFGVDTSSRFGLNQLLGPFGAPKSRKADDLFVYFGKWLSGSGVGMSMDYLSGIGDIAAGNYGDAAYKLAPLKLAADSVKGYTNVMHGKVGPSGRAAGDQWTPAEGIVQGFGFRPSRIAEANAAKSVIYGGNQSYAKQRTELSGRWVGADNPDDKANAWAAVQRFNSQQTSANAKIQMGDLIKQERAAKRSEMEARRAGLPAGARVSKRVPEVAKHAQATYNY